MDPIPSARAFSDAPPIAVVGNINLDLRTSPISLSDAIFQDGETSVAELYESLGGGGANTAAAAAALGGRVHFCGCVGDDDLGHRLGHHLRELGIVAQLATKGASTGRSIALTWDNHRRHFLSCLPSSAELADSDVDFDALADAGCRHLYRADVWFAPRMLSGGNRVALERARSLGMETSIDINWDPAWSLGDSGSVQARLASVAQLMPMVTYAHGNERELCRFTGIHDIAGAAQRILELGAQAVIVHLGPQGSAAYTPNGPAIHVPARAVTRVVNETGTGDVFTAAFLLRPQLPLAERLAICSEVAARHLDGSLQLLPRL